MVHAHEIIPISLVFTKVPGLSTFSVRLEKENEVSFVDLKAQTLPGAYKEALALGYNATHWADTSGFRAIPSAIK